MTVFTNGSRRNMRGILARSGHTVMAAGTGAEDLRMVHGCTGPANRGHMTVLTNICGLNMTRIFTGNDRAVMAGLTIAVYIIMAEGCR